MTLRLRLDRVTVRVGGLAEPVLHRITTEWRGGDLVAVLGPNGAGKTTLLESILGWHRLADGSITIAGAPSRAASVAYLPQRPLSDSRSLLTVEAVVAHGRYPVIGWWRGFSPHDRQLVDQALVDLGIEHLRHRPLANLSGGERQRAWLARAWVGEAPIILLDEPLTGLDPQAAAECLSHLDRFRRAGRLVVVVLHDPESARRYATRWCGLRRRLMGDVAGDDELGVEQLLRCLYDPMVDDDRAEVGIQPILLPA